MSQKIITLSKELANQIAAGEVVERPVSVVKELVENSIDAGATQIEIILEEGGKSLIEICDNGHGISKQDIGVCCEKYTTSKITSLEDLQKVMTFGFRGEALASISSVSEFSLSSKMNGDIAGTQIDIRDGEKNISEVALDTGTKIIVKNLFHNTPARLNYLKTDRTEYIKIQNLIEQMALAYPTVGLTIVHNGKKTISHSQNMSLSERIYSIYGEQFHDNMLALSHEFSGIRVHGYITDPKISFSHRNYQTLFVHKRAIVSPMISKAIFDSYNRFIAPKMQAGYVIFLELDPQEVDVNVHPRKLEVRFAEEQSIYRSVYHGIKNELERVSLVNSSQSLQPIPTQHLSQFSSIKRNEKSGKQPQYHTSSGTNFKNYSPYTNTLPNPAQAGFDFNKSILGDSLIDSGIPKGENGEISQDLRDTPLGRIVGQMHNAYIVVETVDGMQILDQHALAERVIYEKISKVAYIPKIQQLLGGISFQLSTKYLEVLSEHEEVFKQLGFEFDVLSHGNIILTAIPDFVGKTKVEVLFENIISDVSEIGSKSLDEVRHKIWAYTACRSAIKFGDPLTLFEIHALLRDASLDYSATCPHGRPVVYDIDLDALKGKYER